MDSSALGKVYDSGQIIVRQGDTGDCMYVIQQGKVEVVREDVSGEIRLAVLEEGDLFGEMAVFEKEVRSATVRALGEARILTIDKKTFLRRVQEDPSLAFNILRRMSQRIRNLNDRLAKAEGR